MVHYISKKRKKNKYLLLKKNEEEQKKRYDKKTKDINIKTIKPLINPNLLHVSKVIRPFSILIRSADINYDFKLPETEPLVLLFKFDLFCSSSLISSSKQIRWVTKNGVKNPRNGQLTSLQW